MRKTINIISALFGTMLIISGVLKSVDMFSSISLSIGGAYLTIPNSMSIIYIVLINWIGGGCILFHSLTTLDFKNNSTDSKVKNELDSKQFNEKVRVLNTFETITGLGTILISIWLLLRTIVLLTSFEGEIIEMLPLFIMVFLLFGAYSVIPIIMAGKNISLSSKNNQILEAKRMSELRKKMGHFK
jgi:hypothetical protein